MTETTTQPFPEFTKYHRKDLGELRPYIDGEDMTGVSVSEEDLKAGCPKAGGMIARNPKNHKDQWYVAADYFAANFEEAPMPQRRQTMTAGEVSHVEKTLHNSDVSGARENVPDIKVFGDGDLFQLLSKASSEREGWMKSTKAMEIHDVGCVVQVTTQQGDQVAEALVFVPGVFIKPIRGDDGETVIGRELVSEV